MKKSRFTAEQIVGILNEAAKKETKLAEICRDVLPDAGPVRP